nr:Chain C, AMP deaminase 2 [Homo sapiens]
RQISQDVKL